MEELTQQLIEEGYLQSPGIIEAFRSVDRADFLPGDMSEFAYANEALSIGAGQTISQPAVVAFMLELLEPRPGHVVLDIGAGSGWTTALLAHIVGETGKVIALELLAELAEFGRGNVAKCGFLEDGRVEFRERSGAGGYPPAAPYDRILASASLQERNLPRAWKEQLKPGGAIVVPIRESIWRFRKQEDGTLREEEFPGFVFVPFVQ